MHFAGARLVSGFELIASLTGLKERIMTADLVVTGEGSLDAQSLTGKGPVAIARLARDHGKPVILNGKMELGKAAFFTTDYTDFNGFHGEYARVLSKESLTQQVNSMKSITHS
jgi:glycerate kinase